MFSFDHGSNLKAFLHFNLVRHRVIELHLNKLFKNKLSPGQVVQLVGALSHTPKVASLMPGQGICLHCEFDP